METIRTQHSDSFLIKTSSHWGTRDRISSLFLRVEKGIDLHIKHINTIVHPSLPTNCNNVISFSKTMHSHGRHTDPCSLWAATVMVAKHPKATLLHCDGGTEDLHNFNSLIYAHLCIWWLACRDCLSFVPACPLKVSVTLWERGPQELLGGLKSLMLLWVHLDRWGSKRAK